jgi:hypothetical protein
MPVAIVVYPLLFLRGFFLAFAFLRFGLMTTGILIVALHHSHDHSAVLIGSDPVGR